MNHQQTSNWNLDSLHNPMLIGSPVDLIRCSVNGKYWVWRDSLRLRRLISTTPWNVKCFYEVTEKAEFSCAYKWRHLPKEAGQLADNITGGLFFVALHDGTYRFHTSRVHSGGRSNRQGTILLRYLQPPLSHHDGDTWLYTETRICSCHYSCFCESRLQHFHCLIFSCTHARS